jgi:hypothetical protein
LLSWVKKFPTSYGTQSRDGVCLNATPSDERRVSEMLNFYSESMWLSPPGILLHSTREWPTEINGKLEILIQEYYCYWLIPKNAITYWMTYKYNIQ